ncbi:hypothetical protein LTR85_001874 [Meristemomyces frigidus]|nr:hypothetical protein LTR85_001874 [Meristemomyces frigidus]
MQAQTEEQWFATLFRRLRATRKRRSTRTAREPLPRPYVDLPAKSIVSIESEEILPTPPAEPEIPHVQRALIVASKRKYELVNAFRTPQIEGPGEVMIRNHAVALNPIDWKSVDYNFCLPEFPWVTGRESAGVVVKVGADVKGVKEGDRVWTSTYYRDVRAGCFQEYIVVPEHTVSAIPYSLGFESAACLGVGALTAAMTLWKWMDVPMPSQAQMTGASGSPRGILIWGGGAVTGQFAVQLAARAGLRVIVVGSHRTASLLHSLGAAQVVSRDGKSDEQLVAEVRDACKGEITLAIDLVGPETVPLCLQSMSYSDQGVLAPLAMMTSGQEVPANVTVANVEMKRFVLDESSRVYSQELTRLLGNRELILPEMEILTGGLGRIEEGLERLKTGSANGKKLVVSLEPLKHWISPLDPYAMDDSPLAKLPAELRNHIYTLVLKRNTPYGVTSAYNLIDIVLERTGGEKHTLGMSATCKALHAECTPFFYAENQFIIKCPVRQELLSLVRKFKNTIGVRNATALRSITVDAGRIRVTEWFRRYREKIKQMIVGCYLDQHKTPKCKLAIKLVIVHDGSFNAAQRHAVAVSLRVGSRNRAWKQIFESLDLAMRTQSEAKVSIAIRNVGLLLRELRRALPASMRS